MARIYGPHRKITHPRGDAGLVCMLGFSCVGLLTDLLALMMQSDASPASIRLALIASAAPLAAGSALRIIGNAEEPTR